VNNYQNILKTSSICLSQEVMQNYIAGKLSDAQKREVEVHLADCEMCSDELDGFLQIENTKKLNSIVANLNIQIDNKISEQKQKKIVIFKKIKPLYSIAALLLVLIGISVVLIFKNDTQKADLAYTDYQSEEKMASVIATNEGVAMDDSLSVTKFEQENSANFSTKKQVKIPELIEMQDNITSSDEVFITPDSTILISPQNSGYVADNKSAKTEVSMFEDLAEEQVKEEKLDNNVIESETPLVSGSEKNKRSTVKSMSFSLKEAVNQFDNKNYEEALQILDSLKFEQKTKDYYKTLWYKALTYIELKQIAKAKIILQMLTESPNDYRLKAKEKLKKIE